MIEKQCPFCEVDSERVFHRGRQVLGLWDAYPVTPGHALLVSERHVATWFDASVDEQLALIAAIAEAKKAIEAQHTPQGYNIGVNVGAAAGQTVNHLHLHVMPRYDGDIGDPRGGVRNIIPAKGNYLRAAHTYTGEPPHRRSLIDGYDDPFLPHLIAHLDDATAVDIAVAFTGESGVRLLQEHLRDVLRRRGRIRFLTGDYLGVTDPDALHRLRDLADEAEKLGEGSCILRVFQSAGSSFHPKGYIVWNGPEVGTAFIGSSNLTETALRHGVEWNYRVLTSADQAGFADVSTAFDRLFNHPKTHPLDSEWIEAYRLRRPLLPRREALPEPPQPIPAPHAIQMAALEALAETREAGNSAGLVVLATGLGKTWLSAFDSREFQRVLFVAHREEILTQARNTFRTIRPIARLGHYTGDSREPDAEVVFASIQTLGRQRHLDEFARTDFDYIVVDEFHHASAPTYRRLIDYFEPKFLLGLTATPERTDGGDLLSLCGENLVYRCDLVEGIRRGLLAPFDYFGVPDEVDYSNIPWRSNRFDEEALTTAVATRARASNALDQYRKRAQERTIGFCVSQRHADFMAAFFRDQGYRSVAVHSGENSAPRATSLEQLNQGELDILFAVDMFNEGVDLPNVDTIMMLRPTESRILWLQQFGRGLRHREGKRLQVIDYIGNHRSFLLKPRTLLELGATDGELREALLKLEAGTLELPPNCSVTYDLEAKNIIEALLRSPQRGEALRAYYIDFLERTGTRPLAVEAFHDGFEPQMARASYGSWLGFVRVMGGLSIDEQRAHERHDEFVSSLETTPMTKSYKMLLLLAMLGENLRLDPIRIEDLSQRVASLARRYVGLQTEFGTALSDREAMQRLLEQNPINAWVGGRGTGGKVHFRYEGGVFQWNGSEGDDAAGLGRLTRELVEWRLASYLRRVDVGLGGGQIVANVSHSSGRPILFLPSREQQPGIPEGWITVAADGVTYQANFVKIAVNVLRKGDSGPNELPDVLTRWFGPEAGRPGTAQRVVFERGDQGYVMRPLIVAEPSKPGTLQLWQSYMRKEIPGLFGLAFNAGTWAQQGFICLPSGIYLLVTLDKSGHAEEHRYEDRFLNATEMQWQSQNQTTQSGKHGQAIIHHRERGIPVHLFVRRTRLIDKKAAPFTYCGEVEIERYEGEKPMTVRWRLRNAVPEHVWPRLGIRRG